MAAMSFPHGTGFEGTKKSWGIVKAWHFEKPGEVIGEASVGNNRIEGGVEKAEILQSVEPGGHWLRCSLEPLTDARTMR